MKVSAIEAWLLTAPSDDRPHWVSHFVVPKANELLVRVSTDEGIQGIGIATSYTPIQAVRDALQGGILEQVIGADALAPERIYQSLLALTWQRTAFEKRWTREAIVRVSAAVDIAMWDIVGKTAGLPLYRLFGGHTDSVPAYVTCAYYRDGKDLAELGDEMIMLREQGHRAFKAKVGGLSLEQDMRRLAVVREVIGQEADLMVDVNRAWDLDTATEGARLLLEFSPRWLEEPVRWLDDRRELALLARRTAIPLSAGESELTSYACRSLVEDGAIGILQFDCTMMGGFTEGRKLAALCELNHVKVAPHHDCFVHAHIVAGSPAGLIVESFTDPERDPLQAELFENPPTIENGVLTLNQEAGLGLILSEAAVAKYGQKVL